MRTKSSRALLTAAFLATAALSVAPASAANMSSGVQRQVEIASAALKKSDWQGAKTALTAAKAVEGRSDYDNYVIARLSLAVDVNLQDMASAAADAEIVADSPAADKKDAVQNANLALELTIPAKQYDKALVYAKRLQDAKVTDPGTMLNIANAYYFTNDFTTAKSIAQAQIDADTKAGKIPNQQALMLVMSADAGLKDEDGAEAVLEQLVVAYNQPEDWQQMIDVSFGTKGLRDVDAVWLGRLAFLVGAPITPSTGAIIGSTASHLTFFGDAVAAKAHGAQVDPDPDPRAADDKKTIPDQIAAEDKQNGTYNAKLAEALYGYGMYPEAEAAAQKAIAKGGNPDTSEAPMVLAETYTAEGKYDDALANFSKVTGGGPATPRVVKLWVDFVTIKKRPPAPPAAAAKK